MEYTSSLQPGLLRQASTFVGLGIAGTALFFVLYNLFRLALSSLLANALAVALSMGFSFVANRRLTFLRRGRERRMRELTGFTVVFLATLALSSGALVALHAIRGAPALPEENLVLVLANGAAFALRFWLLRQLVFNRPVVERTDA